MKIAVLLGMLLALLTMYLAVSEYEKGRINPFICAGVFTISFMCFGYLMILGICLVTPPGV